ncbi:MAG: RdgB/HAM1 family non-canonical purine NTP pyrophosphatase [Chloroflexota bacterium]|jgi:XTP/dITP diphosphohydrolase
MMPQQLLVATRNPGKVAEISEILGSLDVVLLSLDDVGVDLEVEETGETFEENAILKGKVYASKTGLLTLSDDSGLEVDALDGRPGVHTARFGGPDLTPKERYQRLLDSLSSVPWEQRSARFCCVVALSHDEELLGTATGVCEGMIALEPAGEGGFGYDPIFYLPDRNMTMAQLPPGEKHHISHRGRALAAIAPLLRAELSG